MKTPPEKYRITEGLMATNESYGLKGVWVFPYPLKAKKPKIKLQVISSDVMDWDHVSVVANLISSRGQKKGQAQPTWEQMCFIKSMFWSDEEEVMQLHPKKENHINNHPNCLHLWRPQKGTIPMPPKKMVGI